MIRIYVAAATTPALPPRALLAWWMPEIYNFWPRPENSPQPQEGQPQPPG